MNLIIENPSNEAYKAFLAIAKALNVRYKIEQSNLTKNGYTKDFEAQILENSKATKRGLKNGTLKAYKTAKDMHKDILNEV